VLNVPFQRLNGNEFGTWGSALIAGKATGMFENLAERAEAAALPCGDPVRPDPAARAAYEKMVPRYIELQRALNGFFNE